MVIKKQESASNTKQVTNQTQVQTQQQNIGQHGSILVAQLSNKNVRRFLKIYFDVSWTKFLFRLATTNPATTATTIQSIHSNSTTSSQQSNGRKSYGSDK